MLSCPWLLQYSSLAPFPSCNPAAARAATAEPIKEDEEKYEDDEVDIEEGSSNKDLLPKQVPVEPEEEGSAP